MSSRQNRKQQRSSPSRLSLILGMVVVAALLAGMFWYLSSTQTPTVGKADVEASDQKVFAGYGKSPSCISCHEDAYKLWQGSHHALAERAINPALDSSAFQNASQIRHGSQTSEVRVTNGQFQVITRGLGGQQRPFE